MDLRNGVIVPVWTGTDDRLCGARRCMMANTTKRRFTDEFKREV